MKTFLTIRTTRYLSLALFAGLVGCHHCGHHGPHVWAPPQPPLGSQHDQLMMAQELNAEASKYVVYAHEFEMNRDDNPGWRLTEDGEDHVKRIAANLQRGDQFPVVIERSQSSIKPGTEHEYPIHHNEALDASRRQVVVAALETMGVQGAGERVVIAPAFAEGLTATQAAQAYRRGMSGFGGFGGGGFGWGGWSGFGGWGF